MKQKIKDFLEKMTGMQIIIFQVFYVIILTNIVHIVTYRITGDMEVALVVVIVVVALATVATTLAAAPPAAPPAAFATFATAFATLAALATFAFAFVALATFFVAFAAVDVVEKYKIKYWKAFLVYLVEATLLYLSLTYLVPYSTIIILSVSLLGISYFVSTHYLKTYLVENPPPEKPCSTKRVDYYGNHPMRLASVTTEIPPLPEPLKTKAYRFVYEKLV